MQQITEGTPVLGYVPTTERDMEFVEQLAELDKPIIGLSWILRAIAIVALRNGQLTKENVEDVSHIQKLVKDHQQFVAEQIAQKDSYPEPLGDVDHLEASIPRFLVSQMQSLLLLKEFVNLQLPTLDAFAGFVVTKPEDHLIEPNNLFENAISNLFREIALEVLEAHEKIKDVELVMVAGHQACGKGVFKKILEDLSFAAVSMSTPIRAVATATGRDETSTMDKITVGHELRYMFGGDILVWLGVYELINQGYTKILIEGPRALKELEAVFAMGGKAFGVEADLKVRRKRIENRDDPDRDHDEDIKRFKEREKREFRNIQPILDAIKANTKQGRMISNNGKKTPEELASIVTSLVNKWFSDTNDQM